jgi:hypothetical protein
MFCEVVKAANVYLITGNTKHFPKDSIIYTPADFLKKLIVVNNKKGVQYYSCTPF